jgi:dipeptide/tripeptide permease
MLAYDGLKLTGRACSGSVFGRLGPGYMCDRFGAFNTAILMGVFTLLTMLGVWLPFGNTSSTGLYISSVLLGFGTGSFVSTGATCVGQLCDVRDAGKYLGSCYTVVSIGTLISNPICQEILNHVGRQELVAFLSGVLVFSLVCCLAVRWFCLGKRWRWLVKI